MRSFARGSKLCDHKAQKTLIAQSFFMPETMMRFLQKTPFSRSYSSGISPFFLLTVGFPQCGQVSGLTKYAFLQLSHTAKCIESGSQDTASPPLTASRSASERTLFKVSLLIFSNAAWIFSSLILCDSSLFCFFYHLSFSLTGLQIFQLFVV